MLWVVNLDRMQWDQSASLPLDISWGRYVSSLLGQIRVFSTPVSGGSARKAPGLGPPTGPLGSRVWGSVLAELIPPPGGPSWRAFLFL